MQELRNIDDKTAAYILQTRRPFEDLRQAAAQIAGLLVLSTSGANTASPDHPLLETASELCRDAVERVRTAQPTERARIHHSCLLEAGAALGVSLASARKSLDTDSVLIPLRRAYGHLQKSAETLPGFEMVSFAQGCCAVNHARAES